MLARGRLRLVGTKSSPAAAEFGFAGTKSSSATAGLSIPDTELISAAPHRGEQGRAQWRSPWSASRRRKGRSGTAQGRAGGGWDAPRGHISPVEGREWAGGGAGMAGRRRTEVPPPAARKNGSSPPRGRREGAAGRLCRLGPAGGGAGVGRQRRRGKVSCVGKSVPRAEKKRAILSNTKGYGSVLREEGREYYECRLVLRSNSNSKF